MVFSFTIKNCRLQETLYNNIKFQLDKLKIV